MDKIRSSKKSPLNKRQKQMTPTQIFEPLSTEKNDSSKKGKYKKYNAADSDLDDCCYSRITQRGYDSEKNLLSYPKFLILFEALKLCEI